MLASVINFAFTVAQVTTAAAETGGTEEAPATTETSGIFGGGTTTMIIYIAAFVGIFYFLLIRPGQKQKKAHQELVESLKKGDEVMTSGGIFGVITQVKEDYVMVEIAKKTEVKLSRNSIARTTSAEEPVEEEEEETEEEEVQAD
ncbi:MAG: preprotein translocase subunit YajC [Thermoleophilia bacterium]